MSQSSKEWCRIILAIVFVVMALQGLRLWVDSKQSCDLFMRGFRAGLGVNPGPACK